MMNNQDTRALLTALQAGDYDTVLKGTDFEGAVSIEKYSHDVTDPTLLSVKFSVANAATAHVLTLLVGEMVDALAESREALAQWVITRMEEGDIKDKAFNRIDAATRLAAMLKQEGV